MKTVKDSKVIFLSHDVGVDSGRDFSCHVMHDLAANVGYDGRHAAQYFDEGLLVHRYVEDALLPHVLNNLDQITDSRAYVRGNRLIDRAH